MEEIHTSKDLTTSRDWLTKLDLKGHLFHYSHLHHTKEAPQVCGGRGWLPVQLSPIWPIVNSMGVYQDSKGRDGTPTVIGGLPDCVQRQYAYYGRPREKAKEHIKALVHLLEFLGFIINQKKKIHTESGTGSRLPGGHPPYTCNYDSQEKNNQKEWKHSPRKLQKTKESQPDSSHLVGKMDATSQLTPPSPPTSDIYR